MNAARTLTGRRVLLTRSEDDSAAWAETLSRRGVQAVVLPCITAEPIDTSELRHGLAAEAPRASWLVFTSRRGVESFFRLTGGAEGFARLTGVAGESAPSTDGYARSTDDAGSPATETRIAVVGPATADAARSLLGRADLVGDDGTAVGLARVLLERLHLDAAGSPPPRVLLVLAENARDALQKRLVAAGIDCARFDVYRTVPAAAARSRRRLASLGVDTVFLASPSAVTGFINPVEPDASARLVTIGPSTSEAARDAGLDVAAEAGEPSLDGLLEAMP